LRAEPSCYKRWRIITAEFAAGGLERSDKNGRSSQKEKET
jgi:hypothetical protein